MKIKEILMIILIGVISIFGTVFAVQNSKDRINPVEYEYGVVLYDTHGVSSRSFTYITEDYYGIEGSFTLEKPVIGYKEYDHGKFDLKEVH